MALKTNMSVDGIPVSQLSLGSEKRVILVCDDCGLETTASFSNYQNSQKRYRRNGETYCRSCSNKRTGAARKGNSCPAACKPRLGMRKELHPNYKGGRFVASDGYVMILIGPRQYQREHLLVMEESLGRRIDYDAGERIHHIDLDKTNNDLANLALLPSEQAHKGAHVSLAEVGLLLLQKGLIGYDRNTNRYMAMDKLRELLEQPEEANQQPSRNGDDPKGSTTRCESL